MRLEHLDSGTSGELETMEKLYRRAKAKMMEGGRCDRETWTLRSMKSYSQIASHGSYTTSLCSE